MLNLKFLKVLLTGGNPAQKGTKMTHSKQFEHFRRKLGVKKDAKPGELLAKSQSMIGKSVPRKGIVKALGQTKGNFKKIEATKGKGAAIGALQNKLAKHRGQPTSYGGKK